METCSTLPKACSGSGEGGLVLRAPCLPTISRSGKASGCKPAIDTMGSIPTSCLGTRRVCTVACLQSIGAAGPRLRIPNKVGGWVRHSKGAALRLGTGVALVRLSLQAARVPAEAEGACCSAGRCSWWHQNTSTPSAAWCPMQPCREGRSERQRAVLRSQRGGGGAAAAWVTLQAAAPGRSPHGSPSQLSSEEAAWGPCEKPCPRRPPDLVALP